MSKRIITELMEESAFKFCYECGTVGIMYYCCGEYLCDECFRTEENPPPCQIYYNSSKFVNFIKKQRTAPAKRIIMSILQWLGNPDEVIYDNNIIEKIMDDVLHLTEPQKCILFTDEYNISGKEFMTSPFMFDTD